MHTIGRLWPAHGEATSTAPEWWAVGKPGPVSLESNDARVINLLSTVLPVRPRIHQLRRRTAVVGALPSKRDLKLAQLASTVRHLYQSLSP
jgi:hypothetical protein